MMQVDKSCTSGWTAIESIETVCHLFGLGDGWKLSGCTRLEYELTHAAREYLGLDATAQQCTKSNLLSVPVQDRWMIPKCVSLHECIEEMVGAPGEEGKEDAIRAKAEYVDHIVAQYEHCPLAVHRNPNGGGILVYLGFVTGEGNIPEIVRAVLTKSEITKIEIP